MESPVAASRFDCAGGMRRFARCDQSVSNL